ncbi:MAG: hypothetical protein H7A35_01315 [Planctomycetales bacterium]|nr:hypothetical protein [bacterium]UNM08699.1 MAG: hypothetical protein H7A35_01315 [Planctomycetales bacterium]
MFPASIHAGLSSRVVVLVAIFILCAGISAAAQDSPEPDHSAELASVDIYDSALADELSSEQADYGRLAGQAYSSGDFERAAAFYILALKQGSGDNTTQYNLACCYGLLGKAELAARYLQLSVDNGFSDVHGLQNDPDFTLVRDDPQFSWEVAGMVEQIEKRQAAAGQRIFIPAHTWQPAWVTYPDDYDPRQSYRLLVALHGFGSNAESFMGIRERFADADFIMVCPQAPYAFPLGDAVGYSWAGWTMNGGLPPESFADTQAYLDELIGTMQRTHNISSVYLFGFSQGAMTSVYEALSNPLQVDGAIIFGGSLWDFLIGDWLLRDHPGKQRWFIVHGSKDTQVDFAGGQALRDALIEAGHDVTWQEFDGGHSVPEDMVKLAEQWMKELDGAGDE